MNNPSDQLISEIRVFYQSIVQVTQVLHGNQSVSLGMRAVLEYLLKNGAATVPGIARERRVTRQRIQALVNQLADRILVQARDNPASRRSPLIDLTPTGRSTINNMRKKEASIFAGTSVEPARIDDACKVLRQMRAEFESRSHIE